jgi:hypothetical protein
MTGVRRSRVAASRSRGWLTRGPARGRNLRDFATGLRPGADARSSCTVTSPAPGFSAARFAWLRVATGRSPKAPRAPRRELAKAGGESHANGVRIAARRDEPVDVIDDELLEALANLSLVDAFQEGERIHGLRVLSPQEPNDGGVSIAEEDLRKTTGAGRPTERACLASGWFTTSWVPYH